MLVSEALGKGADEPSPPPPIPTAAEIRARVRSWDTRVFWIIAFVTAVAYLLPFYVDKSFGDWDDYATAFAAGFAGTAVIPWELLPMFRTEKKAGAEAKAA